MMTHSVWTPRYDDASCLGGRFPNGLCCDIFVLLTHQEATYQTNGQFLDSLLNLWILICHDGDSLWHKNEESQQYLASVDVRCQCWVPVLAVDG